jgi:hypothetical protein
MQTIQELAMSVTTEMTAAGYAQSTTRQLYLYALLPLVCRAKSQMVIAACKGRFLPVVAQGIDKLIKFVLKIMAFQMRLIIKPCGVKLFAAAPKVGA